MKEIKRYKFEVTSMNYDYGYMDESNDGEYCKYSDAEKLIKRTKELESDKHIWSIRNEARFFMIGHIVDDLDRENDIQKIKDYLHWQLNYYQEKVNNHE